MSRDSGSFPCYLTLQAAAALNMIMKVIIGKQPFNPYHR